MDHDHDHQVGYVHSIISAREHKAIAELDTKISELKKFDPSVWSQEADHKTLFADYEACCQCSLTSLESLRQYLVVKDFEKARPLITPDLVECVLLLGDYDFLMTRFS